jgi:hypothetical protein
VQGIKVKYLKIRRLSFFIQVSPIRSHEPLKAKDFWLWPDTDETRVWSERFFEDRGRRI